MTRSILTVLALIILAAGIASATTHTITLYSKTTLDGQELKPGNYKVEIEGKKVTITNGKKTIEPEASVEDGGETYAKTSIRYHEADGKKAIREIRIGGTNTKLTFTPSGSAATTGQ
ncbi:MAG: hypothetical protein KJZ70_08510 [Bryobacterales bacterium]|nr:hypothetical protein [Bryobacterales bacterium]